MRIALDTNRHRDLTDDIPEVVALLELATEVLMPFAVLAELRAGFAGGTHGPRNEARLQRFLGRPATRVVYPTEATTHHYARLYVQLRVPSRAD